MNWSDGYPTEINYTSGFYRNLAPSHLAMICVLQGVTPPTGPLTYLELGCGAGFATTLLAATNPGDRFIGVDFSPSHIVEATRVANEAGIDNVDFIEASFDDESLIEALPPCDIICLHGVYTWVSAHQREAIRRIVSKRLKPGGLTYLAYNNMVASGYEVVLQRALRDLARTGTPESLKTAFEKIKQMKLLGAEYFQHNPALARLLDEVDRKEPSYLIHEYLTDHWTPYFFQDLAREMESCKLSYLGSAAPADNRDEFLASADMINLVKSESDPHIQQFLTDISANRRLRNDIFIRGVMPLRQSDRIERLRTMSFALAKPPAAIELKVSIGRGVLELRRPIFRAVLDHLKDSPKSLEGLNLDDAGLVDAITLLSQAAIIHPATSAPADPSAAHRFNRWIVASDDRRSRYGFTAAPRIGSAIPIALADRLALAQLFADSQAPNDSPGQLHALDPPRQPDDTRAFWQSLQIID